LEQRGRPWAAARHLTAVVYDLDLDDYEHAEAIAGELFDVVKSHLG
jgi:hypothetical protein